MKSMNASNKGYYEELFKMAEENGTPEMIWNSNHVSKWTDVMDKLNEDIAKAEEDTLQINEKQKALLMEITEFPELDMLRNEIKPCVHLWEAIAQFNQVIDEWRIKPIYQVVIDEFEDNCADWSRKLNFAKRSAMLNKYPGPMSFIDYILKQIEKFQLYIPLLIALKTKGLENRHIKKIK